MTTDPRTLKVSLGQARAHTTLTTYPAMVRAAGAVPVLLPSGEPGDVPEILHRLDGVVLTGGGDVYPGRYGGANPSRNLVDALVGATR